MRAAGPAFERFVHREHVFQDLRHAAVEEHVGVRPHDPIRVVGRTKQRDARERRLREIEPTAPVVAQERVVPSLYVAFGRASPVVCVEHQGDLGQHLLQRSVYALPPKARAKHVVLVGHALPRPLEPRNVERLAELARHLLDVDAAPRRVEPVEEHPVLDG